MKVLIIGESAREHALAKALEKHMAKTDLYVMPGNDGIAREFQCVPVDINKHEEVRRFAIKNNIELALVMPSHSLYQGLSEKLLEAGIKTFGPVSAAAEIEKSKVFAKDFMKRHGIPTADYGVFSSSGEAIAYLSNKGQYPVVVKADGPALGRGVFICGNFGEAQKAIIDILDAKIFGGSGNKIIIEDFITGKEVSILTFTDGETVVPLPSSLDHKRLLENDRGINTGGMGAIAPIPFYTEDIARECMLKIFLPTIMGLKNEGRMFQGCLYFALMISDYGPVVLEYNCRFGDPEAEAVLPLLKTNLLSVMLAVCNRTLSDEIVQFENKFSCSVLLTGKNYPAEYCAKFSISGLDRHAEGVSVLFHKGITVVPGGKYTSEGGRILVVTAVDDTLEKSIAKTYDFIDSLSYSGEDKHPVYYRKDIGMTAFQFAERKKR